MAFRNVFATTTLLSPGVTRLAACAVLLWGLCGAAVSPAWATDPAPSAPSASHPQGTDGVSAGELKAQREFKLLDFNRDGRLSRQEIALVPRLAAVFDEADTDRDGYVSYDEVRAYAAQVRARRDRDRLQASTPPAEQPTPPPGDATGVRR